MNDLAPSIVFMFISLAFVLVLAWVVIRFLSRIYSQRVAGGEIQIRSSYALGSRQQLYVVNFRDTDYLLGVTTEKIDVLDTFAAEKSTDSKPASI